MNLLEDFEQINSNFQARKNLISRLRWGTAAAFVVGWCLWNTLWVGFTFAALSLCIAGLDGIASRRYVRELTQLRHRVRNNDRPTSNGFEEFGKSEERLVDDLKGLWDVTSGYWVFFVISLWLVADPHRIPKWVSYTVLTALLSLVLWRAPILYTSIKRNRAERAKLLKRIRDYQASE